MGQKKILKTKYLYTQTYIFEIEKLVKLKI